MCGRVAHEWPAYTPRQVAKLPFSHFRALRALYLRAHHVTRSSGGGGDDPDVKSVDVDKLLGIEEGKDGKA